MRIPPASGDRWFGGFAVLFPPPPNPLKGGVYPSLYPSPWDQNGGADRRGVLPFSFFVRFLGLRFFAFFCAPFFSLLVRFWSILGSFLAPFFVFFGAVLAVSVRRLIEHRFSTDFRSFFKGFSATFGPAFPASSRQRSNLPENLHMLKILRLCSVFNDFHLRSFPFFEFFVSLFSATWLQKLAWVCGRIFIQFHLPKIDQKSLQNRSQTTPKSIEKEMQNLSASWNRFWVRFGWIWDSRRASFWTTFRIKWGNAKGGVCIRGPVGRTSVAEVPPTPFQGPPTPSQGSFFDDF